MRGNHRHVYPQPARPRSIPAYAGEPTYQQYRLRRRTVYPRVCGGTQLAVVSGGGVSGLSPRMRGNPKGCCCHSAWRRSIPAYAGEPDGVQRVDGRGKVYPRVCEGTESGPAAPYAGSGLSPRMRGNPRCCHRPTA